MALIKAKNASELFIASSLSESQHIPRKSLFAELRHFDPRKKSWKIFSKKPEQSGWQFRSVDFLPLVLPDMYSDPIRSEGTN
jgi:hypothetical protein